MRAGLGPAGRKLTRSSSKTTKRIKRIKPISLFHLKWSEKYRGKKEEGITAIEGKGHYFLHRGRGLPPLREKGWAPTRKKRKGELGWARRLDFFKKCLKALARSSEREIAGLNLRSSGQ